MSVLFCRGTLLPLIKGYMRPLWSLPISPWLCCHTRITRLDENHGDDDKAI